MEEKSWKKTVLLLVACFAALTLVAGIAVAVTTAGHGENGEVIKAGHGEDGGHTGAGECDGKGEGVSCEGGSGEGKGEGSGHCESESGGNGTLRPYWSEAMNEVAALLGMTREDLNEEMDGGRTLSQIAGEKGIPAEQVVNTVTEKVGGLVDAGVASGDITAGQAEEVKSVAAVRAGYIVENTLRKGTERCGNGIHGKEGSGGRGSCSCTDEI